MGSSYFLPGALLVLAALSAPLRAGTFNGGSPGQSCLAIAVDTNCGPKGLASTFAPTLHDSLQITLDLAGSEGGNFLGMIVPADLTEVPDTTVPEPPTILLCGIALVGASYLMRKFA